MSLVCSECFMGFKPNSTNYIYCCKKCGIDICYKCAKHKKLVGKGTWDVTCESCKNMISGWYSVPIPIGKLCKFCKEKFSPHEAKNKVYECDKCSSTFCATCARINGFFGGLYFDDCYCDVCKWHKVR